MKFFDKETVDGTRVVIGRRAQHRKVAGQTVVKPSATYTAEYTDVGGKRRFESLGVTLKRDARRKAIEIQTRLDEGRSSKRPKAGRLTMTDLIDRYTEHVSIKALAPRTRWKYEDDLRKLRRFCREHAIERADRFDEESFHRFGAWLRTVPPERGPAEARYASKTNHHTLTLAKQVFRWAWRIGLLGEFALDAAKVPYARSRPQACYTEVQVQALLEATRDDATTHAAFTILAFAGLRIGEVEQLRWDEVHFDRGELGMLHIRRGGLTASGESRPKDRDDRFVPISPRLRPVLEALPRVDARVLPDLDGRALLKRLKTLCTDLGFPEGTSYKVHTFRHFFASQCANRGVPYRMVLSWLGHAGSEVLDQYYHLEDAESAEAMRMLTQRGR